MSRSSIAFVSGTWEGFFVGAWLWAVSGDMPYGWDAVLVFFLAPFAILIGVPVIMVFHSMSSSKMKGSIKFFWKLRFFVLFSIGMGITLFSSLMILYTRGVYPFK